MQLGCEWDSFGAFHGEPVEAEAAPEPAQAFDRERALAAGARIRELSEGLTLGGLTIRELIDEGRP